MRNVIAVSVTALLLLVFMPVLLLEPENEPDKDACLFIIETPQKETDSHTDTRVLLETGEGILEIPLEEYLVSVVLCEMPPSFEVEALKAQAVAARTFAMRQMIAGKHETADLCASSSCCQAWESKEDLMKRYGDAYEQSWENALSAVSHTEGEVLLYEDQLIDAVYFSCSGGMTENAAEVWGSDVPYLQSVPSTGEESAAQFLTRIEVTPETFCKKLLSENRGVRFSGKPAAWFGNLTYTEGGGVKEIVIGGVPFTGTQIRSIFGLNSAKFTVEIDENIVFWVSGYGHRVGMSQYGANALAKQGKSYDEILQHYYAGVNLATKNP